MDVDPPDESKTIRMRPTTKVGSTWMSGAARWTLTSTAKTIMPETRRRRRCSTTIYDGPTPLSNVLPDETCSRCSRIMFSIIWDVRTYWWQIHTHQQNLIRIRRYYHVVLGTHVFHRRDHCRLVRVSEAGASGRLPASRRILFFIFLVLLIVSLVGGIVRRPRMSRLLQPVAEGFSHISRKTSVADANGRIDAASRPCRIRARVLVALDAG